MASPSPQSGPDATALPAADALRAAWIARLAPRDAAEAALVDLLVASFRRGLLLDAIEQALLARIARGEDPPPGLGLATLARYRARLERDRRAALDELGTIRLAAAFQERPRGTREATGAPAAGEGRGAAGARGGEEAGAPAARAGASPMRVGVGVPSTPDARGAAKNREAADAQDTPSQPSPGRAPAAGRTSGSVATVADPLAVLLATGPGTGGRPGAGMLDPVAAAGLGPLSKRLRASASPAVLAA